MERQPAYSYERISSEVQSDGMSLEYQGQTAKAYADSHGLDIVKTFSIIESASKVGRRGYPMPKKKLQCATGHPEQSTGLPGYSPDKSISCFKQYRAARRRHSLFVSSMSMAWCATALSSSGVRRMNGRSLPPYRLRGLADMSELWGISSSCQ